MDQKNLLPVAKRDKFPVIIFTDSKTFTHIRVRYFGPAVDSASNRNEYKEHLLEVKAAGA